MQQASCILIQTLLCIILRERESHLPFKTIQKQLEYEKRNRKSKKEYVQNKIK